MSNFETVLCFRGKKLADCSQEELIEAIIVLYDYPSSHPKRALDPYTIDQCAAAIRALGKGQDQK